MAEEKFTKGPWICDDTAAPDPLKITTPWRLQNRKASIATVDTDYSEPFAAEQRANLALILAAPDLLAAAEEFVAR